MHEVMPVKLVPSFQEISEKLVYLNGSFKRNELTAIYKWRGKIIREHANFDTEPAFADHLQKLNPLKAERFRRGLLVIDEILRASEPRSIDDVASARVISDNDQETVDKIIYRT